ncbi:hypothetical protein D3C73_888240 [compost metagenome]
MAVGPAEPKRTDSGHPGRVRRCPILKPVIHINGGCKKIDKGIHRQKIKTGRYLLMMKGQHYFQQGSQTRSAYRMSDVGFYSANRTKLLFLGVT